MTERDLLLAAVLENPADDAARLVYADKLDELGGKRNEARAELIRVQCEMTRTAQVLTPGEPIYQDVHTGAYGDAIIDRIFMGYRRPPTANPAYESLRAREHALLKRWAANFLPKCLRGGYPFARVEGATAWVDTLGGYVEFRRGFVERAGCELSLSPGVIGPAALRFGQKVASLFEANPLTEFTVSFDGISFGGSVDILHAAFVNPTDPRYPMDRWWLGWHRDTATALRDMSASPICRGNRNQIGRACAAWLAHAIRAPAEAAAEWAPAPAIDEPADEVMTALDVEGIAGLVTDYTQQLSDEILQSMGIPPHLISPESGQ